MFRVILVYVYGIRLPKKIKKTALSKVVEKKNKKNKISQFTKRRILNRLI